MSTIESDDGDGQDTAQASNEDVATIPPSVPADGDKEVKQRMSLIPCDRRQFMRRFGSMS